MTLILCVRGAISDVPAFLRGLEVLSCKRDSQQNLGSPASRCKTDRSTQRRCSLSHTLNAQAVGGNCHGLGVKAASVIDYRDLQSRGRTREFNADCLGSRMSGYVGQGFLNNAIQPYLDG